MSQCCKCAGVALYIVGDAKYCWQHVPPATTFDLLSQAAGLVIMTYDDNKEVAFIIDPPYTAGKGKRAGRQLIEGIERSIRRDGDEGF